MICAINSKLKVDGCIVADQFLISESAVQSETCSNHSVFFFNLINYILVSVFSTVAL